MPQNLSIGFANGRLARISLVLLFVALLSACQKPAPEPSNSKPALKVQAISLQSASWTNAIVASGSIHAREEVLIGAEIAGVRVREVLVDVGQVVAKNQVLLRLDDRQLQVALLQAKAQQKQAEASLTVAEADARRGAVLRQKGLVSARDTDQTTANLLTAQAGLEVAKASVAAAELQLSFATVRAPSAGTVSARQVQPGTLVGNGVELFRVIKDNALEWRAELGEQNFGRVKIGDQVALQADTAKVLGRVRAIDAGVSPQTRTGLIYVQLEQINGNKLTNAQLPEQAGLHPGAFVQGQISQGQRQVQWLPASAIIRRDGFAYALVIANNSAGQTVVTQQRIELGQSQADAVEILAGLTGQTQVVASGAGFLADGDKVEVVASTANSNATAGAAP